MKTSTTSVGFGEILLRVLEPDSGGISRVMLGVPICNAELGWSVEIQAHPNAFARIDYSDDLTHWHPLGETRLSGDSAVFLDIRPASFGRFYRALLDDKPVLGETGFVHLELPPGLTMASIPLRLPHNSVSTIFPALPEGSTISKFDPTAQRLSKNVFKLGKWDQPNETLEPGEGAIFYNPTHEPLKFSFAGVVPCPRAQIIPAGFSLCASILPRAGRVRSDLSFPIAAGDTLHVFERSSRHYKSCLYPSKEWSEREPQIDIGEAFWVSKESAGVWRLDS